LELLLTRSIVTHSERTSKKPSTRGIPLPLDKRRPYKGWAFEFAKAPEVGQYLPILSRAFAKLWMSLKAASRS
jgi:hypothetical protein